MEKKKKKKKKDHERKTKYELFFSIVLFLIINSKSRIKTILKFGSVLQKKKFIIRMAVYSKNKEQGVLVFLVTIALIT